MVLQDDGLAHTSSVTVDQLNLPALDGALTAHRRDEPARGGGVNRCGSIERAQQDARAATLLGGELEAARLDAREFFNGRDGGTDPFAAQALGQRPNVVRCAARVKHVKAFERDSERRDGGGVQFVARVAPDDGARTRGCAPR